MTTHTLSLTNTQESSSPLSPPPLVARGAGIESASFQHIDAHAGDRAGYDAAQWTLVRRLIHTSGDFAFNGLTCFHPDAIAAGVAALRGGCSLVVDVEMVRAGLTPRRLAPFGLHPQQFIADAEVIAAAQKGGETRATEAMRKAWRLGLLTGGIVAIGNAPTALLEILRLVADEGVRPALVVGMPVGFISAAESKAALAAVTQVPWITVTGTKGGSALAVAAIHALLDLAAKQSS
ncbi:MAG: precorrin-8X methylmutase [Magnetococcales bacterium]|nr:precorrin-8X methylmutase [Magnetococcales bacterium]